LHFVPAGRPDLALRRQDFQVTELSKPSKGVVTHLAPVTDAHPHQESQLRLVERRVQPTVAPDREPSAWVVGEPIL